MEYALIDDRKALNPIKTLVKEFIHIHLRL